VALEPSMDVDTVGPSVAAVLLVRAGLALNRLLCPCLKAVWALESGRVPGNPPQIELTCESSTV